MKINDFKNSNNIAQLIMVTITGILAIVFRLICPFVTNPEKAYISCLSCLFFLAYFPICLQSNGLSPTPEQDR